MSQMSPEQANSIPSEPVQQNPQPEQQVAQPEPPQQAPQMIPSRLTTKESIEGSIPVPRPEQEPKQQALTDLLFGKNDLSTVENMKKAQQARDSEQDMVDLMRYSAIAGRGLSGYYNKDLADMADSKEKRSGQKITDLEAQQKQLKEDPKSAVSQGYRDMMKKFGVNVKGDASASDIEKIAPWIQKSFEANENRQDKSDNLKYKYSELSALAGIKGKEKADASLDKDFEKMGGDLDPNKARTGEMGKNQARLNAAGRVKALVEASGGNPSGIPIRELATTVGNMLTMGSQTAVQQINELVPHTMRGDSAKIQEWLTGEPTGRDQQKFVQMYSKIAEREASVAGDQLRDGQFRKAYGTYKHLKNKDPERFNDLLSTYSGLDKDEIKKLESEKGFTGGYKASPQKSHDSVSSKPKTIIQNGHTYNLNESTGEYE